MSVKQDVQVWTINVIRSNVGGGRTAALAVANGALYPTEADLHPEAKTNQRPFRKGDRNTPYRVSGVHVPLEGKFRRQGRFGGGRKNSRINSLPRVPRKTDVHHPVTIVCRREVLIRLGGFIRMKR